MTLATHSISQDIVVAIAETAFVTSDQPLVLSFENHCSKANQLRMAKYCIDAFGDMLMTKPLDAYPVGAKAVETELTAPPQTQISP